MHRGFEPLTLKGKWKNQPLLWCDETMTSSKPDYLPASAPGSEPGYLPASAPGLEPGCLPDRCPGTSERPNQPPTLPRGMLRWPALHLAGAAAGAGAGPAPQAGESVRASVGLPGIDTQNTQKQYT